MPNGYSYTTHTPGPWAVDDTGVWAPQGGTGDIVCNKPDEDCEESLKRWPANARLIAAAPAMLSALRMTYPILTDKAAREEIGALLNTLCATSSEGKC